MSLAESLNEALHKHGFALAEACPNHGALLDALEAVTGSPLPTDFREFYSGANADGRVRMLWADAWEQPWYPLLGLVDIVTYACCFDRAFCEQLAYENEHWNSDEDDINDADLVTTGRYWCAGWVNITGEMSPPYVLDLEPGPKGRPGQISLLAGSPPQVTVEADSFGLLIGRSIQLLETEPPRPRTTLGTPEWIISDATLRHPEVMRICESA